jgi:hypothetical protein
VLDMGDSAAGIALVPGSVEVFGGGAQLHGEVARQVLRLGLASFLAPEAPSAAWSAPIMIRASEPPRKVRRSNVPLTCLL